MKQVVLRTYQDRPPKKKVVTQTLLVSMYRALFEWFGPRHWWPANSPFEVCVGAILTQNTSWRNVAKAIDNLRAADMLDAVGIYRTNHEELAQLIKPAGYFNVKAIRLRNFVNQLVEKHGGNLDSLFSAPLARLREELLSVRGIGKETADSIILYAASKPIFVVDAYTKRVLYRHGLISGNADYDTMQSMLEANLPLDVGIFNDFHAQLVAAGHFYCKRIPLCDKCPLQPLL
ncbi:MAG: endonuclease III domain-containing protein [Desulfomonilaceae bacterium]